MGPGTSSIQEQYEIQTCSAPWTVDTMPNMVVATVSATAPHR